MVASDNPSIIWSMWFTIACVIIIFLPRFVPQTLSPIPAAIEKDAMIQLRQARRPLVILIPGTWIFRFIIKRSSWHLSGSVFSQALVKELPQGARVLPYEWSLANTIEARNKAASELCTFLQKLKHKKFDRIILIGHSHGGVVAVQCSNLLETSLRSKTCVCTIAAPPYRVIHAAHNESLLSILLALSFIAFTFISNLLIYKYSYLVEDSIADRFTRGLVGAGGMAIFLFVLYRTKILSPNRPTDAVTVQNASLIFGKTPHLQIITRGDGVFNLFGFARRAQQFTWNRMSNCFHLVMLLSLIHVLFFYGLGGTKSCVDQGPWWYFTTDRCSTIFEVAAIWIIFLMGVFWGFSRLGNLLIGLTPTMTNFGYRIECIETGQASNVQTLDLDFYGSPFGRHSLYMHEEIVSEISRWITSR